MGTRSITKFIESNVDSKTNKTKKTVICAVYRRMDGYPSGMGSDLAEFLVQRKLVNGYGSDNEVFNGMGCLAAQVIAHLKTGDDGKPSAGSIYMTPSNAPDEEYRYEIIGDTFNPQNGITLKVVKIGYGDTKNKTLFKGTPQNFLTWLTKNEDK